MALVTALIMQFSKLIVRFISTSCYTNWYENLVSKAVPKNSVYS